MNKRQIDKLQRDALRNSKPPSTRHKWETMGKRHVMRCVKCGCLRDRTILNVTRYELDDVLHLLGAPPCDGRLQVKPTTNEHS